MAGLTKVTAGVIAANAVVDSFGTQSITGDKIGLTAINANNIVTGAVTGDKLGATSINANNIVDGTITNAKIDTVANTKLIGTITATQMAANSVNSTILQTNSVENYMATSGRPLSNRNLIINGAMQIAQRNTSVTGITTANYYTADRWRMGITTAGTWTMNVESSAPTNTEFRKSANLICTSADSSLAAGDFVAFQQRIEGQNLQGIKKGTSEAESLTVSFWVKSSNTGTYIFELIDEDNTRQISKSYTIDTANTWEKKTITVPPDTTGQFDNDNELSLQFFFWLAAGTTYSSGTLNDTAWASVTSANRAAGQLNLANEVGNYFAFTGVQLETGTVATPYEWIDYGVELALCQRYYYLHTYVSDTGEKNICTGYMMATTQVRGSVSFKQTMRTTPTLSYSGGFVFERGGGDDTFTALAIILPTENSAGIYNNTEVSGTSGVAGNIFLRNTGHVAFSAEL
jgi:hypothetical protein